MRDYLRTRRDDGGAHTGSDSHTKAMHHLLTSVDETGIPVLRVEEGALLVCLALVRLLKQAGSADTRQALRDVAQTCLAGAGAARTATPAAVDDACRKVGIG